VKLNDVDLNKVAVFCHVVDAGNYRRASETLNVTPSALSQTIRNLEHALGAELFERVGKKLVPNRNGLRLHREFRRTHFDFLRSIQDLGDESERVAGLLRVGAYLEFAKVRLAPLIRAFREKYPGTQLKLVFDSPSRLQRQLETGNLDVCFSIYPSAEARTIESRPVYHEELVLIAPEGRLPESPTMERLLELPVIEYFLNHQPIRRWLFLHYKKRPKKIPIAVYAASAEMVLELVREGAGIGVVPKFLLGEEARLGLGGEPRNVAVVRPSPRRYLDHIWLLEKKSGRKSAVHEAFVRHVAQGLRP
jgi:LysR family cyn operon transcriptional activator